MSGHNRVKRVRQEDEWARSSIVERLGWGENRSPAYSSDKGNPGDEESGQGRSKAHHMLYFGR